MSRTFRKIEHACFIRFPKTFQEHRDSEACRVDGIKKRKARGKKRLPSAWDDKPVAAKREISPSVSEKS